MGALVFDAAVFSLTIYKAITIGRGGRLLDVIVRDGASSYITNSLRFIIHTRDHVFLVREIRLFVRETLTFPDRVLCIVNLGNILMFRVRQGCICQFCDSQANLIPHLVCPGLLS
jgi:hypothetical protein